MALPWACTLSLGVWIWPCWAAQPQRASIGYGVTVDCELPSPPKPYDYDRFIHWLNDTKFNGQECLKWKPEVPEFNIDAALKGKFHEWLTGDDATAAVQAAKSINKFLFTTEWMLSGDDTKMGTPGIHLYILQRLRAFAHGARPTFLDAGCGPGYLLLAWNLMAGASSRAIGLDNDAAIVKAAQAHLSAPEAIDPRVAKPLNATAEVYVGDVLQPSAGLLSVAPGSIDAINVGVAVWARSDLSQIAHYLRIGGGMIAPICRNAQPAGIPKGKCAARLTVLVKASDESLQVQKGDPGVDVRFIVAERADSKSNASPWPLLVMNVALTAVVVVTTIQ